MTQGNRVVRDMFLEVCSWWKKWPVARPCDTTSPGVLKELRRTGARKVQESKLVGELGEILRGQIMNSPGGPVKTYFECNEKPLEGFQ